MRYLSALLLLCTFALVSCTPKAATSLPQATMLDLGDTERLSPGETVMVEGHTGSLTFVEVTNDSRCPEGTNCIQAGEAEVMVNLGNGNVRRVTIAADYRSAERIVSGDVVYNVARLTPYPKDGQYIEPGEYELVVTTSLLRD